MRFNHLPAIAVLTCVTLAETGVMAQEMQEKVPPQPPAVAEVAEAMPQMVSEWLTAGKYEEALPVLEAWGAKPPAGLAERSRLLMLGKCLLGMKRLEEAVDCLQKMREAAPDLQDDAIEGCVLFGEAYSQLGRTKEAAQMWQEAARLKPLASLKNLTQAKAATYFHNRVSLDMIEQEQMAAFGRIASMHKAKGDKTSQAEANIHRLNVAVDFPGMRQLAVETGRLLLECGKPREATALFLRALDTGLDRCFTGKARLAENQRQVDLVAQPPSANGSRGRDISRKLFPYWRYVASVSESPRGSHRVYAGKVWRKEDPIWHRIFPPWDFNCKCSVEEVAADEVEPDDVEPTTTDDMMPDAVESGFAFDPAEALRVYDPSLIQDETLRGNVEQRLEEMGCARREDGKLEMPMGVPEEEEKKAEQPEKDDLKVVGNTIQVKEDSSAQLDKQTLERLEKRKEENLLTQKRINAINLKGFHRIEGEHSREQDAAAVNPHFSTGEWKYTYNCQRCVVAYEARRRGWNVEAKGCPGSDDSILNGGWSSIFKDARLTFARGIDDIERYMGMVFGEGSRALVQMYWKIGGSHLFFVERINGKTVFTDPQNPNANISDFFRLAIIEYTTIYRVDNLEIDVKLLAECCINKE